ncbi:hypothetical protein BFJ66_g15705 [Fusarium oxysporum f. sp. cepae]|uniref:DUF6603 domain-containing protein n=1 Tax=Fusarium oxysporum f. sp. cepae TaxID=396571 RepID=A0A3L6NYK6_FUSOX|nr:hypothetical protein BFJ65_g2918 [Fusarium oxysporum f. sp. cepae]RKK30625.1 hypothetical protein BFJ67_g15648 [Fusarium oxysporum f. sp. cepae]RKK31749.1 hypothetical protein BFJ66_g15705 [Fusarium oxysporum f. sp. cepae]
MTISSDSNDRNPSNRALGPSDAATYSIYASSAGQSPGENIQVLASGSNLDKFVAGLNSSQVITLSSAPNPTANFNDSDETIKWFQNLDADASGSITVDGSATKSIESFQFSLSQPWPLEFSSASDVLLFTFGSTGLLGGDETGSRIEAPGIDSTGNMLICGLDFANMKDITGFTVKDVFKNANQEGMTDYIPLVILGLEVTLNKPPPDAEPKRNALWFVPSADKRLETRLQFQLSEFDDLQKLFSIALDGLVIESADVVYKSKMLLAVTENGEQPLFDGQVTFSIECSLNSAGGTVSMLACVEFTATTIDFTFMFLSPDPLAGILSWLAGLADDEEVEMIVNEILGKEEGGQKVLPAANLRRLRIGLDTRKDPQNPRLGSFSFDIEVSANFGRGESTDTPVFLVTYNWNRSSGTYGTLSGQLWNDFDTSDDLDLEPEGEKWAILKPLTASPALSIEIATLIPGQTVVDIPDTLPSQITVASIELSQESFSLSCQATANPPSPGSAPQPYLGEVVLAAYFNWGSSSGFTFDFGISVLIDPPEDSELDLPASFVGTLGYNSAKRSWELTASINGLYAAVLAEFFHDDEKAHVGPLINSIAINTLSVEYTYEQQSGNNPKSVGSRFAISGDLVIAGLRLNLDFTYTSSGFAFSAALNPAQRDATIGDILTDLLGSSFDIPDFVSDTLIVGDNQDAFRINIQKMKDDSSVESFQFLASLKIGQLQFLFSQLHSTKWGPKDPSKRLFKAAINGFGNMKLEIPLVGTLYQPLDELYFLFAQDPKPPRAPGQLTGLTREDIGLLNSGVLRSDQLLVADKIKPDKAQPTDLLVPSGCHFAVIIRNMAKGERACLLSYGFMTPKPSSSQALVSGAEQKGRRRTEEEMDDGGPSAQAPFKKDTGPVAISNVSLKYKAKTLSIVFDATFQLGPIGFSLLGFTLNTRFKTLDELPTISVNIDGLAASFDRRPLTIAGIIVHGNDGAMDYYAGGLIIGFRPYQFQAAGFYGVITLPNSSKSFQSVFVFAKLNGPLMTLAFAEISGICGGFGYNSSVKLPSVDQVSDFPFINSGRLSDNENAQQVLMELVDPSAGGWFQPLDSTYWGAIGMKLSAFRMLSVDAVVAVQFGDSVKLGIFAAAVCDIPSSNSRLKLAHAELGIAAVLDFDYGFLKIEAQLSPRSYILSPNCHLTGGFALCYWFDAPLADRARIGDFVFSLGGYHQAFRVPVGYPNPPRLGISWDLGGGLSISGEAYFAITTKACMAGGRLHAAFKAGPLSAWFDAFANFLINYRPFYFDMSAGVSVGVGFSIDFWFIHIRISVQIGAELYLWGPPVAGRVHVDFWIVAFDINFGDHHPKIDPVSLSEFYELVLQDSPASSFASASALITGKQQQEPIVASTLTRPKNEAHNFLAESGLLNPDDQPERGQEDPWTVRAGAFVFVAECKMAISTVKTSESGTPIFQGSDVFSKPMGLTTPMTSTLQIQVIHEDGIDREEDWQFERYTQMLPSALWAKYDRRTDPRQSGNNVDDLLNTNDGSPPLMTGVRVTAPRPTMSPDPFPAYKVADADLQELTAERKLPVMVTAENAWEPVKPNDVVKQRYEDIHEAWVNPSLKEEGQQSFVGALAEGLGWSDVGQLKSLAGIPERLKRGFMNMYVASPLLTA